jgi:restriction system protein
LDLRDTLAHDLLEAVKKISPKAFERVVVELLVAMGYGGALEDAGEVLGKSGDGGIDGTIKQDKLGLDMVYVQAKRWQDNVGSPEVMGFCGSITARHANKGVMIATAQFLQGRSGIREEDSTKNRPNRRQTARRTDD